MTNSWYLIETDPSFRWNDGGWEQRIAELSYTSKICLSLQDDVRPTVPARHNTVHNAAPL
ncbi:hypothetical protein NSO95_11980 [Qipengyuania sp. RS5-5]|uniref:Uncharacterized protein n=1 Tax=Parerythrobacter lacustris TaxID=2969984 RepID=A0ABT1XTX7_9SPHN|nr:hypothetical protein [Parerythrobacter lacustris]